MAQVKEVRGPGPRGAGQPRPKVENPGLLLKRIMDEVFQHYLLHCIFVLVCIVVSALANVQASLFLKTLIDDYIVPMTQQATPDFGPLAAALGRIGCVYAVGVLAAWLNSRIMVNVTQGTLRNLRTKLFTHMESLPIRYFDQHPHGDIMSVYTNDVDTLRQMLSQSIPQLTSSAITIVSVLTSMVLMSWQLTIVTLCMVALMLFCTKKITSMSGKYFIAQQKDLGKVNGYIEEMMEGQKVVKVFTHEQKTLDGFRALNDKLKDSAKQANGYANIIMPVTAQLGNISYAVCALVGAAMAVGNVGGMTLGTVMAFLSLNKSFNMPISQVAVYRQGKGQVALLGKTASVKPPKGVENAGRPGHVDNHNGRHTQKRHNNLHSSMYVPAAGLRHEQPAANKPQHQSGNQHRQAQNSNNPAAGPPLRFDQFSKHLNTSRNSSSKDLPVSSRVSSVLP